MSRGARFGGPATDADLARLEALVPRNPNLPEDPMPKYFLSLLAVAALGACGGSSALQRHAAAAVIVNDTTIAARAYVMDLRRGALERAAADARAGSSGVDVAAAVHAAADRFDAGPLRAAIDALIAADEAYVLAVLAWAAAPDERPARAAAALGAALDAYEGLRRALGDPGGGRLPAVPSAITELVGGGR